jgi:protein SYS1
MQTIHYLTLSVLIPPSLLVFAEPHSLNYEGGATNVGMFLSPRYLYTIIEAPTGMIMDWRELASRLTVRGMQGGDRWKQYRGAWSGGRIVGFGDQRGWDGRIDPMRGWVIAFCWLLACVVELSLFISSLLLLCVLTEDMKSIYPLYMLIRRPRMILDFALTLVFNHLVLTTYYSASLPTSLFFYLVLLVGAAISVVVAEHLCVKREMREGLSVLPLHETVDEEIEMGGLGRRD